MTSMPVLRRCRRAEEAAVDRPHHAGHGADPLARGARQEPVGDAAEDDAQPRHLDHAPAAHVGRGEHQPRAGLRDALEQEPDVLGPVGEVDVEDHDVGSAALREAGLERLAEAEIPRVMDDADPLDLGGELFGDGAGLVAAAVVDDDQLEPVLAPKRPQVAQQHRDVIVQDRGFVVGGQHDRYQRAPGPRHGQDLVQCEAAGRRHVDPGVRRVGVGRVAGRHWATVYRGGRDGAGDFAGTRCAPGPCMTDVTFRAKTPVTRPSGCQVPAGRHRG